MSNLPKVAEEAMREWQPDTPKRLSDGQRIDDYLFDLMSELEISHLSFDYGMRMIGVFDFDGDLVIEGETLRYVLEQRAAQFGKAQEQPHE